MSKPFKDFLRKKETPVITFNEGSSNYQIYVRYDITLPRKDTSTLLKLAHALSFPKVTGIYTDKGDEVINFDELGINIEDIDVGFPEIYENFKFIEAPKGLFQIEADTNFKVCKKKSDVLEFLKDSKIPLVVKADGLAAGKGVTICHSKNEVVKISNEIFLGKFKSSKKLVLEEFLTGEEASYFLIVDKKSFSFFGSAQDHKKVGEKETGPNTGGMGAYSPAPIIKKVIEKKIIKKIIKPTLLALKKKGHPFTGFLYAGLMIKNNEPYLIEYNVRMGDPECQVILPRLKTDFIKIIDSSLKNSLHKTKIKWKKNKCMTIVLCSKGYPGSYQKNKIIKNLNKIKLNKESFIFHAGTKIKNKKLVSSGGRVLNITSFGKSFSKIRKKNIKIIRKINWSPGFYRKDIGWRVI